MSQLEREVMKQKRISCNECLVNCKDYWPWVSLILRPETPILLSVEIPWQGSKYMNWAHSQMKAKCRILPRNKFDLNDSIFRTLGALGISINREVAKNDIRLLASKFAGMSIAASLTVSSKWKRLICNKHYRYYLCNCYTHIKVNLHACLCR